MDDEIVSAETKMATNKSRSGCAARRLGTQHPSGFDVCSLSEASSSRSSLGETKTALDVANRQKSAEAGAGGLNKKSSLVAI